MFERKKVLVILDNGEKYQEEKAWLEEIFNPEKYELKIVSSELVEEIEQRLVLTDVVFNFSNPKMEMFKNVQERIEFLKIQYFGNSLAVNNILQLKDNFKKLMEKQNFKVPVAEEIKDREPMELFKDFIFPARIYSKENEYFSEKITTLEDLEREFQKISITPDFRIEEFIDGDEYFILNYQDHLEK
jgi:D-alanine-D-alanine ligase-like ATP-grasp enzyme